MRTAMAILAGCTSFAGLLSGCTSIDTGQLPADATAQLLAHIADARDAARTRSALGWSSGIEQAKMLAANPADQGAFTDVMCENALYGTLITVRKLSSFNEEVAELAKAPEDTFAAYSESIKRRNQAIKDAQDSAGKPPSAKDLIAKEDAKCRAGVARDLGIGDTGVKPASMFGVIEAFQKLVAIPQLLLKIHEAKQRAEAVRSYVLANEQELNAALDALGRQGWLQESLSLNRRQLLRKAYVAYSEANDGPRGLARVHAAEDFSRYAGQYQKIRDIDGNKLIEDQGEGLRAAYAKLVESARNPNGNPLRALDNFLVALKNLTDLRDVIGDFKTARKDAAG